MSSLKVNSGFRFRWFYSSVLALFAGFILTVLSSPWITDKLIGNQYLYLDFYYNYYNCTPPQNKQQYPPCKEIVIIDAYDSSIGSRVGMASLLKRLAELNPAVVGMDILYPNTHESTAAEDSILAVAAGRLGDKLVMACRRHGKDSLEHSFFTLSEGLPYASVNAQSFYGYSPVDSVSDKRVETFTYALAKRYVTTIPDNPIINYESLSFREISTIEQITSAVIDGKIVLIGDCKDSKDVVELPFLVQGKSTLSGVQVNAYQLASLIQPGRALKPLPSWLSWLICIILVFSFGIFFCWWSAKENIIVGANEIKTRSQMNRDKLLIIGKFFVILLVEVFALVLLNVFIHWTHYILNVLPFMSAVLFFETSDKLVTLHYNFYHPQKQN